MLRVKKLFGGTLSLRDYNAQISKIYAMVKTLNKLTELSMPKIQKIMQPTITGV
ncbi:Mobile element protein [Candidatus Enterovibrio altilux]|uniref:Mobile element protein n=1 Tax=Candidatus Enterovibrio altilux TaxID=1927128 RepID=A0A291B9P8_9GAMM|nr:Mobile element protein [Candidatus Enterovibrio luxaltus]